MILQPRPGDLPGIVQILRADEAHHGVHEEGLEPLGKTVAPGLHGHLIGVVVGIRRQLRALAGFKVHDIGPFGGSLF